MLRSIPFAALGIALVLGSSSSATAAPPKRVVALTPFSANTMATLGVRPVGLGQALGSSNLFAPSLRGITTVPLTHPAGPNLEQLVTLQADFVFTSGAWRRGTAGMKRLGMRVADREPRAVSAVPRQSARIGKVLGKAALGRKLARLQTQQIAVATRGIKRRPKVLLVLGVGSQPYAFLSNSWGGDVVRRAGGQLITSGLRSSGGYARISDEAVVAANPDVIIAVPHGTPANLTKIAGQLRDRPGWRTTKAARNKRVYLSTDNTLLQPIVGVAATITGVRRNYLGN